MATFVFPAEVVKDLSDIDYKNLLVGDLFIQLYATSKGYAYFANDVTSVYRKNVSNSVTTMKKYSNREELISYNQRIIDLIEAIDKYSKFKYTIELNQRKTIWEFGLLVAKKDRNVFKIERLKIRFKELSLINKLKIVMVIYFPNLYYLLKRVFKTSK